jgi:LPS O-antigen subunit length determinant protein (WzzB/FepE family)
MHPELKEKVKEKLSAVKQTSWITDDAANQVDGIINFMNTDMYTEKTWSDFKRYIDVHDKYRNENYYNTFPEFGELIKAK